MIDFPNEESKWAWLAGLVEGEGCLGLYRGRGRFKLKPSFIITNTSLELLKVAQSITGGQIYKRTKAVKKGWNQAYNFFVPRAEMLKILQHLLPFLLTKKDRAKLLIEYLKLNPREEGAFFKADEIYLKIKSTQQREPESKALTILNSLSRPMRPLEISLVTGLKEKTVQDCLLELYRFGAVNRVRLRQGSTRGSVKFKSSLLFGKLADKMIYYKDGQENALSGIIINTLPKHITKGTKVALSTCLKQMLPYEVFQTIHSAINSSSRG